MPSGTYLYGFTDTQFTPEVPLLGLGNAPVRLLGFRDVAAVVSDHPAQKVMPLRSNLEPHHRIVRHLSSAGALVPAAFGHISENEHELLAVVRDNYDDIRQELERLANKAEMGVKLLWNVNVFGYMVGRSRELREMRDRVFRSQRPLLDDKMQLGSLFEAVLNAERERLSQLLLEAMAPVTSEALSNPPHQENVACDAMLLIERRHLAEFTALLRAGAEFFDSSFTLDCTGPLPPYSFVRLRLQAEGGESCSS